MPRLLLLSLLLISAMGFAQAPPEKYTMDPASTEQPGVPKGELIKLVFDQSKIFPGTTRDYWIYVPAQYKANQPACVYVNQDGIQWKAPTVFDNLIHRKEMPVTIGIFITPGKVMPADTAHAQPRFNRSFEYDGLGDAYARFLMEEILPDVEKHQTKDGRVIRLSKNGNDRAIGGSSSGAVCAFTAAWERPDAFSRVFSAIGTYIGLRGAHEYPTLIRKYEPKPLRVFLQDGTNDLNIYAGDWWKANESMERALSFAGYEVNHAWGQGAHNGQHGTSLFPDAMRWLWKDWPKPVQKGSSKNQFLSDLLIPGEEWELVGEGYKFTEGTSVNATGEVFFQDVANSKTYKIDKAGKPVALALDAKRSAGTVYGPDGKRYVAAMATKQIISYDENNKETVVADSIACNDLVVASNGNVYVTAPNGAEKPGELYLVKPGGKKQLVDAGLKFPNGITLSPDQTQLYVTESATHWVWSYMVLPDGTLANRQRYGWLHVADNYENAWADGLKTDVAGRIYVTTRSGLQILDQPGRVNAIIPLPSGQSSNCCFGGPGFNILYVSCDDKVYRRKLNTTGARVFQLPVKPPTPRL